MFFFFFSVFIRHEHEVSGYGPSTWLCCEAGLFTHLTSDPEQQQTAQRSPLGLLAARQIGRLRVVTPAVWRERSSHIFSEVRNRLHRLSNSSYIENIWHFPLSNTLSFFKEFLDYNVCWERGESERKQIENSYKDAAESFFSLAVKHQLLLFKRDECTDLTGLFERRKKNIFMGGQWPFLEKIIWSLHFSEWKNNERESSKSCLFLLLWTHDPPALNSPQRSEQVFTEERRCWMMNNGEEDAAGWRGWWSLPAWSFYASWTSS